MVFTADEVADASLSGIVFNDADGDGQQDANESGLGDWTVYLDANSNGQLDTGEVSAVSDSGGGYTFENLFSGDYRVSQVIPDGWQQTTPALTGQLAGRVINGTPTSDFPSVGMIGASGSEFCSGTLISETFVLTAAHCAEGVGDSEGNFTVGGQTYGTSGVHLHPGWDVSMFGTDGANDIALYELSQVVSSITPSPIFTGTPAVGEELTLVGFGAGGDGTSGHDGNYGTKRVGTTPIDQVTSSLIHWSFDNNNESNTAPGDSGGPAFLLVDGVYQVAGVTSGGDQYDAGIGDNSYDTRVDAYQDWISQLTGNTDGDGGGSDPTPNSGFYEVTLGAGEQLTGLDFGNWQEPVGPTDDHVDSPGVDATALVLDSTGTGQASGTFEEAGDRDVFALALGGPGSLKVELTATDSGLDTYLRVYDSQGTLVSENDDNGGTLDSSVTFDAPGGTYYLQAGSYVDAGTGAYSVNVVFTADDNTNPGFPNPGDGYSIEVIFSDNSLTLSQRMVFDAAAARWSEVIVGDVPDVEVFGIGLVDDLVIYASAPEIDGSGGILGQAAPTEFRSSWLPSSGFMQFDRDDLSNMESSGSLLNLILHEMGHVIGIGTIWSEKGLLEDTGGSDPRFIGEAATQAYNEIFGNAESSVPVANTGGPGTANSHWREQVFSNELMTGYLDFGTNSLSRVTVASLADIGYVVNLDAADDYSPSSLLERVEPIPFGRSGEAGLYYAQQLPEVAHGLEEKQPQEVAFENPVNRWRDSKQPVIWQQVSAGRDEWHESSDPLCEPPGEFYSTIQTNWQFTSSSIRSMDRGNEGEVDALMEKFSLDDNWSGFSWKEIG